MADPGPNTTKRRYEIRYLEDDEEIDPVPVLGWHDTADGAQRMANSWKLRPSVTAAWVVDLEAPHGGDFCNAD